MTVEKTAPDLSTVRAALDVARRAPSVHNTQPWRWAVAAHSVHLFADRSRRLPVIDPDGRELTISCGAALHHAQVAFRALGWRPEVHHQPNPADRDHLAAIEFNRMTPIDEHALAWVTSAANRRTDRRPFLPSPVHAHLLERISGAARSQHGHITLVTEPAMRREVLVSLAHADTVQRANPMYRAEVGEWGRRRLGAVEGVPARVVPVHGPLHRAVPGRTFGPGELESPPAVDDGAILCVLSTPADDELGWLHTGEALSAMLLAATAVKLASCTLSQVAEVRAARDLVRRVVLHGHGEPQLVVRIGWPVTADFPGPSTPRRALDDVMHSWTDF